ncbi:MAG TPA: histidine kinase dimerization/phosphoacceptor domain -containing protein, partial [Kofleriaceae bacterium]|nr:histidine kinase dimerization/phosphoacceptor domain -containing protein [Kofleriaceae bacterium]
MRSPTSTVPASVLVVDDVPAQRLALREILSHADYRIEEAGSGQEALMKLSDSEFAVLLIDAVMPDMNGFKLAEKIRGEYERANVPILFVTAQPIDIDLVFRGYRAGAVDYLVKPLDPEVVRAKVSVFVELYRQRKLIEQSLREKEILLREIHHRVKNNLQIVSSLLNLQSQRQPAEIQSAFLDSTARIRSIALVHENLYQMGNFATINEDAYLRALVTSLQQTYGSTVEIEIEDHGVELDMDTAILCGLIVNELVSNALKHAFPDAQEGKIIVSLAELQSGNIVLEVRDNGVGLPREQRDASLGQTMGFQIVKSL